jgi:23S rRNA (cytidine1920-2'-O)/16S rRNA (cytidine1409-2'-O)-methyltransferase
MSQKIKRIRADELLVLNKLCDSRTQAKTLILAGQVRMGTERIEKSSRLLPENTELRLIEQLKYVGRGGLKMENFLADSGYKVTGLHILDLGASTGGFTDCLLQQGASEATCVDVGHGQLHYRLRTDDRVHNFEKTNLRNIAPQDIPGSPFPFIVMDLSFISLRKVLPAAWSFLAHQGKIISLVKPQFESKKEEADSGKGIIRDPEIHKRVLDEIKQFAKENLSGSSLLAEKSARPQGTDGNQEFFLCWEKKTTA